MKPISKMLLVMLGIGVTYLIFQLSYNLGYNTAKEDLISYKTICIDIDGKVECKDRKEIEGVLEFINKANGVGSNQR